MKGKIIFLMLGVFFSFSIVLSNANDAFLYSNNVWHFQISIPANWHYTESNQMIAQANDQKQYQKAKLIEDMGLVVALSQYSLDTKTTFNSNINISAKNIEFSPKPVNESEIINYAKKILQSIAKYGDESNIEKVRFNGLRGIKTAYTVQMPTSQGDKNIFSIVTILIDTESNNYFIITGSCLNETRNEFEPLFNKAINSFKLF